MDAKQERKEESHLASEHKYRLKEKLEKVAEKLRHK